MSYSSKGPHVLASRFEGPRIHGAFFVIFDAIVSDIRQIEIPEKDLPLRADVSLLGSLVGKVLAEQHGEGLLDCVDRFVRPRSGSARA